MNTILLNKSTNPDKKFMVKIGNKTIHFGQKGYQDYTTHKDINRKKSYIARHKAMNEKWGKKGIKTSGFWSRWLLWNKKTIDESINHIEKKFNVNIIYR